VSRHGEQTEALFQVRPPYRTMKFRRLVPRSAVATRRVNGWRCGDGDGACWRRLAAASEELGDSFFEDVDAVGDAEAAGARD
jgi:hypothetical protein